MKRLAAATDATWRVALAPAPGWMEPGWDDRNWTRAESLGPAPMSPWGEVEPAPESTR
jgi:hypothetical protein